MDNDMTLKDKINKLEAIDQKDYQVRMSSFKNAPLFHGIRTQALSKLENILQTGYILPGKQINNCFESYTGEKKYLYFENDNIENANHGEYISVTPFNLDSLSFKIFVMENLFLVLNGSIPAQQTFYLNFDDYEKIMKSGIKLKNLYSYATDEYMVKEPISIDNILTLGFYSDRIILNGVDINVFIKNTINILEHYNADFDFEDFNGKQLIYSKNK